MKLTREIVHNDYGTYFFYRCVSNIKKGTIVFIHGFATTSEYHDIFIKYIINEYDYIAIQLPGAGYEKWNSSKNPKVEDMVDYSIKLINSLNLDSFYLIGHSMGGGIAPRVANVMKDKVRAMVLTTPMNSRISFINVFNYFKFNPKNFKKSLKLSNILYFDLFKTFNYDRKEIEEYISEELKYQLENRKFFIKLKKSMFSVKNLKEGRKNELSISNPTLVIVGKNDKIIPSKSLFSAFEKKQKNEGLFRIEVMNNSAHLPFREEEEEYAKKIIDFFNENK